MEFPPILVINLDERTDRWDGIQKNFTKWPVTLERVSAVKASPGWKGCYKSHLKCVQIAKERQYPWVLLIEDDCRVEDTSLERFQTLLPLLWDHDYDIFNGGPSYISDITKVQSEPPLYKIKGYAAHFSLIKQNAYDKILNFQEKEIDVLYSENLQMICTYPRLAIQEAGWSDIIENETNYLGVFETSDAALLKEGFQDTSANTFSFTFAMVCLVIVLGIQLTNKG